MHDAATHSFLSQIPLIISPFLKLPQPVALPLNYATLPRGLPPSSTSRFNEVKAVVASVDEQQRLATEQQSKAKDKVSQWESDVLLQETMQQRRIAPGYLDSDVHILHPTHLGSYDAGTTMGSYATPQQIQETSLRGPSAQQISAAPATTSLPPYSPPGHDASARTPFGYGQQLPASMHPYTSSTASSAASSTPSLNGYSAASTPQHAPALNSLPSLPSQTTPYRNESSTYQGQHTPTYDAPSYQRQPSISSQRSSPVAQPNPSLPRQASVALPDRAASPSPPGPPLPPHPPAEFVNRPLRISTMRKPLVSEFPWSSTASFAARTFSGTVSGISSTDSKYTIPPSSSTRTDTSSLYEGASFRRSSLPRLDSYRSRDTGYNSLDAKLNEYLGSSNANTNGYSSTSYNTLQRIDYSLPREQPSHDMLGDVNLSSSAVHESVGLIDLEDEDLAPAQTPAPAAPSLAAPITNSFSVPGTMTPSSSALASSFPDFLSDDHVTSLPNESVLAARSHDDPYASASRFKYSANYLDKDLNDSDISHADDLYGQPTTKSVTADSDSDHDFSALTEIQATTSLLAQAEDIETPVDESETDYNAVSVMEEDTGAERAEGVQSAEEEPDNDDAKIEEMLRQLQEEIDMEEKTAARAKREARRKALEEAEAATAAEDVQVSEAVEAPTERVTDETPAEGTQQESAPSKVFGGTKETVQRDERTDGPTDEDVAEEGSAYDSREITPAPEADVEYVLEQSVNNLHAEDSLTSPYKQPDLGPLSPSLTDPTSPFGLEMPTFKTQPEESEPAPESINGDSEFSTLQKPAATELSVVLEDAVEEKEEPLDLQEMKKVETNPILDPTASVSTTSANTTSTEDDDSMAISASTAVIHDAAFDEGAVSEGRDKLSDIVLENDTDQRNEEYLDTEGRGEEKISSSPQDTPNQQEKNETTAKVAPSPTALADVFASAIGTNNLSERADDDDSSVIVDASTPVIHDDATDEVFVPEGGDKLGHIVLEKNTGQEKEEFLDREENGEETVALSPQDTLNLEDINEIKVTHRAIEIANEFVSAPTTNTISAREDNDSSGIVAASTPVILDNATDELFVPDGGDNLGNVVLEKDTGQGKEDFLDATENDEEIISINRHVAPNQEEMDEIQVHHTPVPTESTNAFGSGVGTNTPSARADDDSSALVAALTSVIHDDAADEVFVREDLDNMGYILLEKDGSLDTEENGEDKITIRPQDAPNQAETNEIEVQPTLPPTASTNAFASGVGPNASSARDDDDSAAIVGTSAPIMLDDASDDDFVPENGDELIEKNTNQEGEEFLDREGYGEENYQS
ncbi:hypothetical protein V1520DRAFT_338105 [Lipomyces starkeyi]|uniref:Uncharacterized protein n=1 Tax=Lipomyces starkeyi NRRL Y-11557 TaxID=675824 RepID=A0A1E3QD88_LIPST|nr:hypothetical protein LIPSTDRAFT_61174 [Lipomyces starkeyi NRRL Y-11557]